MNTRIPTANIASIDGCDRQAADCFFCTAKGKEAISSIASGLNARQRQLLILLAKSDSISKHASDKLLHKLPIKQMIEEGLIEQISPCSEFCALLPDLASIELVPDVNNSFTIIHRNVEGDRTEIPLNDEKLNKVTRQDVLGVLDMLEKARIQRNDSANTEYGISDKVTPQDNLYSSNLGKDAVDPMLQLLSNNGID